jgi:hypothetical protein
MPSKNPPDINIRGGDTVPPNLPDVKLKTDGVQQFNSTDGLNYTIKVFALNNNLVKEFSVTPRQAGLLKGSSLAPPKYHFFVYSTGSTHGAQHTIIISSTLAKKKRKHKKVTRKRRPKEKPKRKGKGRK